jgi:succinyl-diaminopimelate desuccinylase
MAGPIASRRALDAERAIVAVQEAIRIPSVFGDEERIGRYLADLMRDCGFTKVEFQEVAPGRSNVIGELDTGRPGPTVVLQGHMDTVPEGAHPEAFAGTLRDDRIWGRGTSDMKGPVVAAILAVSLARKDEQLRGRCIVVATVDEESEKRGMFGIVDRGLVADFGICVEPTDLRVAIAQKGCVSIRVTTKGKAAHGANPHMGINAIAKMANVIAAIEAAPRPSIEVAGVGPVAGTYNIGVIAGGEMFFIVPDTCDIWVDRRTVPGESQAGALAELEALVHAVVPDALVVADRQDWTWERIRARGIGSCSVPVDSPIVGAVAAGVRSVTGHEPEYIVQNAWCETDFLVNDLGIPTVNFGPGRMELAHTSDEHIEVASLLEGIEILADALVEVGGPDADAPT